MVGCLKASSPPPPPRERENPPVPGIHLRGLSVTIARAPALGFTLLHSQQEGCTPTEKETGYPRTPPALQERPQGHTDLARASSRQEYKEYVDGKFHRYDDRSQECVEAGRENPEAARTCQGTVPYQEEHHQKPLWYLTRTTATILLIQGIFITLFTYYVRYGELADASHEGNNVHPILGGNYSEENPGTLLHHQLLNIEIIVFVGMGMRLAFLREYSYSSMGWSLLLSSITLQWSILCGGFLQGQEFIYIDIYSLLRGCMASVSVGVAHGAVMGLASPIQLIVLTLSHVPIYTLSNHLASSHLLAVDRGGCVTVHMFGALFGVSACRALRGHWSLSSTRLTSSTTTQVTACIGTVVVVVYLGEVWSVSTVGDDHHRALINTLLATLASLTLAFPASSLAHTRRKFSLVRQRHNHLDMLHQASYTAVDRSLTNIQPVLRRRAGVGDTAGVGPVYGVAGVRAALQVFLGMAAVASDNWFFWIQCVCVCMYVCMCVRAYALASSVYVIFPGMSPRRNSEAHLEVMSYLPVLEGPGRTASQQAAYQLAALLALILIALLGGALTGLALRLPVCERLTQDDLYNDASYWQLPQPSPGSCHAHTHASTHAQKLTPSPQLK
nr:ammonium transporter Rh type B-like [Cherax quadricarinatus]